MFSAHIICPCLRKKVKTSPEQYYPRLPRLREGATLVYPQIRLVDFWSADVGTRPALPQNTVYMLIGSQVNYEIKIHVYNVMLRKIVNVELIFTQQ